MAERTTTTFMMSQKTQESMRKKLEEWQKTKPQTASSKAAPFQPANMQKTKRSDVKSTRKSMPHRTLSYRPKENNFDRAILKRKSFSAAALVKTTSTGSSSSRRPLQTSESGRLKKTAETPYPKSTKNERFSQNPPQSLEIEKDPDPKKARRSTFTKEELVFHENPPSSLEIETEQDQKKARRSTFTLDSPSVTVEEKKDKQPNLRKQLEDWRKEKQSVLQTKSVVHNKNNNSVKPAVNSKSTGSISSKPHQAKPLTHPSTRGPSKNKSLPTSKDLAKKVPPRKSLSAIYRQNNKKPLTKKTDVRKSTCPVATVPKKASQPAKQIAGVLKKPASHIPKTPSTSKMPSAKTPEYMDKSKSLRERLEMWRKEKGKTPKPSATPLIKRKGNVTKDDYKKPACKKPEIQPIPLKILSPEIEDKTNNLKSVIATDETRKTLKECLEKINRSNADEISCQLDEMQKGNNDILQIAEYWLCKVKISQDSGDHDRVLCLYQQAIAFNAEPLALIKDEMSAYQRAEAQHHQETSPSEDVMQVDANQNMSPCQPAVNQKLPMTPHQGATAVFMSPSSTIRYSVTKATPYRSRLKTNQRPSITPVRRSVRLERRSVCYPPMLQDHSITVKHLDELPQDMKDEISFKPNFAVQSDLNDVWREIMDY